MMLTQEMKDRISELMYEYLDTKQKSSDVDVKELLPYVVEKILEQEREKIIIMRDKESSVEAREAYQCAIDSINNLN